MIELLRRILGLKSPGLPTHCRCGCAWPCTYLAAQGDGYPMHRPSGTGVTGDWSSP